VLVRSDAGLAVVSADRSRLAQALGNVMSNAVEHGSGDVTAVATRSADRVRIEVTNATAAAGAGEVCDAGPGDRGRGLEIAADAAAGAGGSLSSAIGPRRARTVIDLPIEP
jgi:signal transduction histidine kinase